MFQLAAAPKSLTAMFIARVLTEMDERPIGVLNFFRHWPYTNVLIDQAQQQLPIDGTVCIDSESEISFNDSDLSEGLQPISIDRETM